MTVDSHLISQVREHAGGEDIHTAANLIGAYESAVREYQTDRDPEFRDIAREGERELRALLTRLRLGKADVWDRRFGSDSF